MGGQFGARLVNHLLGVLLGEFLKLLIALDRLLEGRGLIAGHVTGNIFPVFPDLMFEVCPCGALGHDRKLSALHALDLGDLLNQLGWIWGVHGT